jgi:hypothetical protein
MESRNEANLSPNEIKLHRQINSQLTEIIDLMDKNTKCAHERDLYARSLERSKIQYSELSDKLEKLKKATNQSDSHMADVVQRYQDENTGLRAMVNDVSHERDMGKRSIASMQEQIDALREQNRVANARLTGESKVTVSVSGVSPGAFNGKYNTRFDANEEIEEQNKAAGIAVDIFYRGLGVQNTYTEIRNRMKAAIMAYEKHMRRAAEKKSVPEKAKEEKGVTYKFGQFDTSSWPNWRDIPDLPVMTVVYNEPEEIAELKRIKKLTEEAKIELNELKILREFAKTSVEYLDALWLSNDEHTEKYGNKPRFVGWQASTKLRFLLSEINL